MTINSNDKITDGKLALESNNPLIPFFKPFYWQVNDELNVLESLTTEQKSQELYKEQIFLSQNRPLNSDTYKKAFFDYISPENFFTPTKSIILEKMWQDSKIIYDALEPLIQLGMECTIDLTGGCVRDFVLNHENNIKDLDFMIKLHPTVINTGETELKYILDYDYVCKSNLFTQKELNDSQYSDNDTRHIQTSKLFSICMNRTTFVQSQTVPVILAGLNYIDNDNDIRQRIMQVIKICGSNYPIDLLLTEYDKPDFINAFDFDLCKTSFCIFNSRYKQDFPQHYTHLISRFSADLTFWADVINKTLTFNVFDKTQSRIDSSFGDHLHRLVNKYPNYQPQVIHFSQSIYYPPVVNNNNHLPELYYYAKQSLSINTIVKSLNENLTIKEESAHKNRHKI